MMAIICYQLELHSRNEGHGGERFFMAWFEVGKFTFSPDLCSRKAHNFDMDLKLAKHKLLSRF